MIKMNTLTLLMIPVAAAINIIGGNIAGLLKLPIYLDVIGTILAGMLGGPIPGIITGLLSNSINAISQPQWFPFAPISMAIGLLAGIFSQRGWFNSIAKFVVVVVIITAVAIVMNSFIAYFVFEGATGTGSAAITASFVATGKELFNSILASSFITEIGDKTLAAVVAFLLVKSLPKSYLIQLPLGEQFIQNRSKKTID